MTNAAERYDRFAAGYVEWWAPVLEPKAVELLDRVHAAVAGGARRVLDIGTGTGTLARAAVRRWPDVEVVGIDVSSGMARAADAEADRLLDRAARRRFSTRVAPADSLPFADASFDVAISSFVLQLVPNRYRALREAGRVLRSGGHLAYVTWLVEARAFRPDMILDDLLDEIGVGARESDPRSGDVPTVDAAAAQLRRAGFRRVQAEGAVLSYPFTVERYVSFVAEFDERDLVEELPEVDRDRLLGGLRDRLAALPSDDLVLRYPIVYASGVRP